MGIYVGFKVRFFSDDQTYFNEISVSEHDYLLGNLFFNNEISHTSIKFDRHEELSDEENELLNLYKSEEDEILVSSKIFNAKDILPVFDKIYRKVYRIKMEALENDLNDISILDISQKEKIIRRKTKINYYFDFESSFGVLYGIIKVASEQDYKIQIIEVDC